MFRLMSNRAFGLSSSKRVIAPIKRSYVCNRLVCSSLVAPKACRNTLIKSELNNFRRFKASAAPQPNLKRNPNLQLVDVQRPLTIGEDVNPNDPLVGQRPEWWWTGLKPPADGSPVVSEPTLPLENYTRESIFQGFANMWLATEVLFSSIQGEEAFKRPQYHNLRHPLIFYLGHPAVIFLMKLRVAGVLPLLEDEKEIHFEQMFETGVDEMSWDDMSKNEKPWPTVREVVEYRRRAFQQIKEIIDTHPDLDGRPIRHSDALWSLAMGVAHEAIHLETSSVLMRETELKYLKPPQHFMTLHPSTKEKSQFPPKEGDSYPANPTVKVSACTVQMGKPHDYPTFGWDNEYGSKTTDVEAFDAKAMMISNGEFHEFVASGGYSDATYWTKTGWQWRRQRNAKWPTWWVAYGPAGAHRYKLRTVFHVIDMPWSWPVEVNLHEAAAYANWRTARDGANYTLPNEVQMAAMRGAVNAHEAAKLDVCREYNAMACRGIRNTNLSWGSPSPVNAYQPNQLGFYDTFGNVWEYTRDVLTPMQGFAPHPYYEDFSMPCMDDMHYVITGGSFISRDDLTSPFARYHFRPHFFQHMGFRLVVNEHSAKSVGELPQTDAQMLREGVEKYETQKQLEEYLALHYGSEADQLPVRALPQPMAHALRSFPSRCATRLTLAAGDANASKKRALDVGCAVGGASFELAREYDEVIGIDFSAAFVKAAETLRTDGKLSYHLFQEGERYGPTLSATRPADVDAARISFQVGDACNLPVQLGTFDAVLAANLLCRLPAPMEFLDRLVNLVNKGGVVMFTSPFSWLTEYTPKDRWIGARNDSLSSAEALNEAMQQRGFKLLEEGEETLMIREHHRKYQFIIPHVSIFQKVE
eukprot:CAMPEP_0168591932 /NCGR_PEP_ID=MMETSP0420-20121227/7416_1 /TAXON_ID=498008 /ORGANISM="Pessonella sp." /LENGTH=867 /DNA_ID=CAMNT_0008627793 /DNA_START=36 /DNA_END=2639 /DNA_ORIENTATION=+